MDSHSKNFPTSRHINEDISSLTGERLLELCELENSDLFGIVGGPPCQGFSAIGKRNVGDKRNTLFLEFFRLVSETKPNFFLAENVLGILNQQYNNTRDEAFRLVTNSYKILAPLIIHANEYGAATTRTRVFFIGVREDINGSDKILDYLTNYKQGNPFYVKDALSGLPLNISEKWNNYNSSWQEIELDHSNEYLSNINRLYDNVGDPIAIDRYLKNREVSGFISTRHSKDVSDRYSKLAPGCQDRVSKSTRLKFDGFCPTLRAGTDNTKGSFQAVRPIHPTIPRVITPREAARLQGFPDWFQFHETIWHSFRQIGNSVCPVAAEKVLLAIRNAISI